MPYWPASNRRCGAGPAAAGETEDARDREHRLRAEPPVPVPSSFPSFPNPKSCAAAWAFLLLIRKCGRRSASTLSTGLRTGSAAEQLLSDLHAAYGVSLPAGPVRAAGACRGHPRYRPHSGTWRHRGLSRSHRGSEVGGLARQAHQFSRRRGRNAVLSQHRRCIRTTRFCRPVS